MDKLRLVLANVQKQLTKLTVTQKLLIATLCIVFLMTLFLVSQYAGAPTMVALLQGGTGDDQQRAASFLSQHGFNYKVATDGKIMLMPDQRYLALGAMAKEQALPGDKRLLFQDLAVSGGSTWLEPLSDKQMKQNYALQNELARVIRAIPGVDDASVFISHPADNGGIGAAAKKPVAQVAVFPPSGQGLDQPTVNALADLVAGSVSGLDPRDVAVIDGRNRRSYRAVSAEDLAAGGGTYIEQVARVEKRVQEKIAEHLGKFIPDVIVSVNAIVDAAKRESVTTKVLGKGDGTVSVPVEETTSTETSTNTSKGGGEPGLQTNIGMSVNGAGGSSGTSTSHETSTVKNEVKFGETKLSQRDASGRPTKINVTVSVPREYVVAIVKQKKAGAGGAAGGAAPGGATEPTDLEISAEFDTGVKTKIEEMISPLVETDGAAAGGAAGTGGAAAQIVAGTVKAFLIPVSMASMGSVAGGGGAKTGLMGGSGGLGGLTGITGLMENGLVKTAALGLLAIVALGMMLSMVRKAGKAPTMPTAEELVGIPPALEPGTDVVGEAVEGDTAMQGIEVDDESLKTGKMIEEIGALVKSNPASAAGVFNRWLSDHE